jgi:hypothetical protein
MRREMALLEPGLMRITSAANTTAPVHIRRHSGPRAAQVRAIRRKASAGEIVSCGFRATLARENRHPARSLPEAVVAAATEREQTMRIIEQLERRVLLDGDVSVSFVNGDLFIGGDDGDNQVRILQPRAGTIRLVGLDDTTINGEESADFSGSLDDIRINTRQEGRDTIEIQGPVQIGGGINARLGEGAFVMEGTLGPVEIADDIIVRRGSVSEVHFRNEVIARGRAISIGSAVTAASTPGLLPDIGAASFSNSLDVDNPYFPLVPGTTYVYELRTRDEETGEDVVETVTTEVTNDTRTILGVQVRVVHDTEVINGLLIEDTFDWYAQDDNGNVWYFGEDTTEFEYDSEGNRIGESTEGSFEAGVNGARAGVVMLANPQVGNAYFQEVLIGEATDRGEVLATDETLTTDLLGTSSNVLRTRDTTAQEPDTLENKLYVAGLGLVQEIALDVLSGEEEQIVRLVSATRDGQPITQVVAPDNAQGANAAGGHVGLAQFLGDVSFTSDRDSIARNVRFENNAYIFSTADVILVDSC